MNLYANTTIERVMERRKRRSSEDTIGPMLHENETKRPRLFLRLESESSVDSLDDTESVYSLQDKETDVARDTSDTETPSDLDSESGGELVTLEYEVASESSDDGDFPDYTSSGTEDLNIQAAAEGAFAAVLLDSSMEAWETDGETSEGSTVFDGFDLVDVRKDFWTCMQCKSRKDNPSFPYCDKCFQNCWQCKSKKTFKGFPLCIGCYKVRKTFFPPRPRPSRKRKHDESNSQQKVKLDTLQNCLNELKKNAGSRKDAPASSEHIPNMNFEDIVVPQGHLHKSKDTSTRIHDVAESDSDIFDDELPPTKKQRNNEDDAASSCSNVTMTSKNNVVKLTSSQESSADSQASCSYVRSTQDSTCSSISAGGKDDHREKTLELNVINLTRHVSDGQQSDSKPESDSGISSKHSFESDFTQRSERTSNNRDGEMCIMCANAPKNGIFLHGSIGHMCCCYKCAMRVWKNCKRCPVCNCKVKNVVKLFTS